jgi:hypothetical protein
MKRFDPYAVDVPRLLTGLGLEGAEHKGDSWVIRCPSGRHNDSHPSFAIKDVPGEEKHGVGYCFACKFGGTAAQIVQHVMDFADIRSAYGWIAEHAMGNPIDVTRVTVSIASTQKPTARVPEGVVIAPLVEWPTVPARFALERGLTGWQVDRWSIGYAVTGALAGRIFLPAWGTDGELQNYTARSFLRSPLRYKSAARVEGIVDGAMFGEQLWPSERNVVVVTEGIFNALAVERVIRSISVAAMFGSNVCLEHLVKLSTFKAIVVLTDPDYAGDRAYEKLAFAFARHRELTRAVMPAGVDANDMECKVPDALRRIVTDAGLQALRRSR